MMQHGVHVCGQAVMSIAMSSSTNNARSLLRRDVLSLYRRILTLGHNWQAKVPASTVEEKSYIINETRRLFKKNKHLTDEYQIRDCIREAQARLDIAVHYQNPYPRPVNLPQGAYTAKQGKTVGEKVGRQIRESRPIYVRSIDSDKDK